MFQSLPLDCPARSSAVNNYGPNIYLSIPQTLTNTVKIYELSGNRFRNYLNLTSFKVDHVNNFNIGPRSFLAVGGHDAAIYRFTRTGLEKELVDINLPEVKYFLPVSINNYREDVVLLVHYDLDHSTHSSSVVRILLYSGGFFNVHDEVPCVSFGEEKFGVSCMLDQELDSGLFGSTVVCIGKMLGVLIPKYQVHSGLFLFNTSLEELENPTLKKIKYIFDTKDKLEVSLFLLLLFFFFVNDRYET